MGYYTKDGIPHINGQPARPCTCDDRGGAICTLQGCFQPYLCPECGAHLSVSGICLNACHLGSDGQKRFAAHMAATLRSSGRQQ